jgi:Zn ribbon nucleic-acid-binding protein
VTLTCAACESIGVVLVGDNGAVYPETRVERYECQDCGHEFTKTLTA